MQQSGIPLLDLESNTEYKLGIKNNNAIITHSGQRIIRIHRHVSNLTQLRSKCGSELHTSNIAFSI